MALQPETNQKVSASDAVHMIHSVKKMLTGVTLASTLLLAFAVSASAYNGPWNFSVIAPKFGAYTYTELERASGVQQKVYVSFMGGQYGNVWVHVIDSNGKSMTDAQAAFPEETMVFTSNASAGGSSECQTTGAVVVVAII